MKLKKELSGNSITEAVVDVLEHGLPMNQEMREMHFESLRKLESNSARSSFAIRGGKNLCLPLSAFRRDLAVTNPPGQGPEWVGSEALAGASDLLSWSACVQLGAVVLTGLGQRAQIPLVTKLPEPEWIPEIGIVVPASGDLGTNQIVLVPKRLSAEVIVSNQLLVQTSADFDKILIADLSRALSSVLDQTALYGDGVDKPLGIANTPGTLRLPYAAADPFWEYLVSAEVGIAGANVSMESFGNIMSPAIAGKCRITPVTVGGDLISEMITNPVTSTQVTDDRLFFGSFGLMVIGLFGDSVDLILNPYTRAGSGQTQIVANMFADVGLRLPAAFGCSTAGIPVVMSEPKKKAA